MCPSAPHDSEDSLVFGVVTGVDQTSVTYLSEPVPESALGVVLPDGVEPTQVFRFTAKCAEHKCRHFQDCKCTLGDRIVKMLPTVSESLPKCSIRGHCRWFRERGRAACLRCPGIVSHETRVSDQIAEVSTPPDLCKTKSC